MNFFVFLFSVPKVTNGFKHCILSTFQSSVKQIQGCYWANDQGTNVKRINGLLWSALYKKLPTYHPNSLEIVITWCYRKPFVIIILLKTSRVYCLKRLRDHANSFQSQHSLRRDLHMVVPSSLLYIHSVFLFIHTMQSFKQYLEVICYNNIQTN